MGDSIRLGESWRLDIPVNDGAVPPATPTPLDPTGLTVTFRDSVGAVALTRTIGQITRNGVGDYTLLVSTGTGKMLPVVDTYAVEIETTSPDSVTATWLDVRPNVAALLSFDDARKQLGRSATPRGDDALLARYVDAVNDWITGRVGAVLPQTVTAAVTAAGGVLRLPVLPVLSVVSATVGGSPWSVAGWTVDADTGVITPGALVPSPYWFLGTVTLTWRAGRVPVPRDIPLAASMLLDHLWEIRRTGRSTAPAGVADEMVNVGGYGYAVPNRVAELLEPYLINASALEVL